MKTSETFYAVELPGLVNPRKRHLAVGDQPGPQLYYFRLSAVEKKNSLALLNPKARVVKVRVTCIWS